MTRGDSLNRMPHSPDGPGDGPVGSPGPRTESTLGEQFVRPNRVAPDVGAAASMERAGDQIGPFKLLEKIGEGGFGVVWLAERREPMVQRVALKIIKPGMDSAQVIARFEAERQALAVTDHPNVARVFDGGVTSTGRPYFVMEHVPGEAITTFCDRKRMSVGERLELFISVCEAVQHAHTKGIIHRDIKPSNVLVEEVDGRPLAKVIDFGVAKAIAHADADATVFTQTGAIVGTPEYMSPEQAGGEPDIDTRTDVYSLGVLLYELLTGLLPFDSRELRRAGYAEIQRIIREVDPPKPSTRLSGALSGSGAGVSPVSLTDAGRGPEKPTTAIADNRRTRVADLVSTLRRELEWVPIKAMRKSREERYRSPAELADDLRLYLTGQPLIAGPESRAYRARKFVKRNKGALTATTAVMLALAGGLAIALIQAHKATQSAAAEARARARAETVSQFVITALESSDPHNSGGSQGTTVLQAMDKAIEDIESGRFREDSETEAALRSTIGAILLNNGQADRARPLLESALATRRRLFNQDHPDLAASLNSVANCLNSLGQGDEALKMYEAALEMRQRCYPGDHPEVIDSLNNVAFSLGSLGRDQEALPRLHAALDMARRLFKGDDPSVAVSLNNLAGCLDALGRFADALPNYQAALEMRQRLNNGRDHPDVAVSLNNVAYCLGELGRNDEALPKYQAAFDMRKRLFKGDHPDTADSLNDLALCLESLGRKSESLDACRAALEMRRRLFEGDHPYVARSLSNLAGCLNSMGRSAEALPVYQEALAMRRRLFGGDHPDVANTIYNLALCLDALGRGEEALPQHRAAAEMLERVFKGDHPYLALSLRNVANCLIALGRTAEALPIAQRALSMGERVFPAEHPNLVSLRETLSRCNTGADTTGGK